MVKLKHQSRRDGGISVRGTMYKLDSSGCVEVSEDHAAVMLQGCKWRKVGMSPPPPADKPAPSPPAERKPAEKSLQDMTRTELMELAQSLDMEVDFKASKLKLASTIRKARKER